MKKFMMILWLVALGGSFGFSSKEGDEKAYPSAYRSRIDELDTSLKELLDAVAAADIRSGTDRDSLRQKIHLARQAMKNADFWLRYLAPLAYKKINGPLPVEWETEVFEKFEAPYKREGAGLTLAELYLDEPDIIKDSVRSLISRAIAATAIYTTDSVTADLRSYDHFFVCNRLFLLNLAAIYTTGFECPDPDRVIPELADMLFSVGETYTAFNISFPSTPLTAEYLDLYGKACVFVQRQPADYKIFDHFSFLKDYINPLFLLNQKMIARYKVVSKSMMDYTLNKKEVSIFDKGLYNGQNAKGIFLRVTDEQTLAEIDRLGKLLFYDPLLSANNKRSCASCHKPDQAFTDTTDASAFQFDHLGKLDRNTPSLLNAGFNHLIMWDGKHTSLQDQTKAVITNPAEMGGAEQELIEKILSCGEYRKGFQKLLKFTPAEKEISFDHIASTITFYYAKFSHYYAAFDEAMSGRAMVDEACKEGFNLFMSKAQCATCHFVPQFNGVKPPYVGSEFEVLGVPSDKEIRQLSPDKGRFLVNPAKETMNAFRTGTVRNAALTKPYMHNGVFRDLREVIDFYDAGGGVGCGLKVPNQTLSADSLKLTAREKDCLIAFISSLNERVVREAPPLTLPKSKDHALNARKVGGEY